MPETNLPQTVPTVEAPTLAASKRRKYLLVTVLAVGVPLALLLIILFWKYLAASSTRNNSNENTQTQSETLTETPETTQATRSTGPDLTKLPLGDQKFTASPQVGYIYLCNTTLNGGGAFQAGPWIDQTLGIWNLLNKVTVDGQVTWSGSNVTFSLDGNTRTITGNGLPAHTTGTYPIASSDDAYQYDRNPNTIQAQTLQLQLPANPTADATPHCMGGEVGIMLSGVAMFNGFDAGGRDAAAWEIQDACGGHPQVSGVYHYHSNSDCLDDHSAVDEHSDLVGYALDGFGIYGEKGEDGNVLSTADLDECHGHTHEITWDGVKKEMYHYHLTADFPYSLSCFRGATASMQVIPNAGEGQGTGQGQPPQGQGQMPPPPPK